MPSRAPVILKKKNRPAGMQLAPRMQSRRSVFIDPARLIGIILSVLMSVPSAAPITAFEISR
jgi:hypothetical protein